MSMRTYHTYTEGVGARFLASGDSTFELGDKTSYLGTPIVSTHSPKRFTYNC